MSSLRDRVEPSIGHKDLMLAIPAKAPFSAQGWVYELKYDGFRCLASKVDERVRLLSRNGNDMADRFPEVAEAMRAIRCAENRSRLAVAGQASDRTAEEAAGAAGNEEVSAGTSCCHTMLG
jgi:hypothetical protein